LQKASLYYYVSSKEDLLTLVYERSIGAFTEQLTELASESITPTEKLCRAIETQLVALSDQLALFTVYLHEQRFINGRLKSRIRTKAERHAELLAAILEEGIQRGEFRKLDVKMTARAIIGMCNWLYQWYSPDGKLSPHEIAAIFSDLVLNGVKAGPRRKPRGGSG
jgi:AcrR family transcriptional regulator